MEKVEENNEETIEETIIKDTIEETIQETTIKETTIKDTIEETTIEETSIKEETTIKETLYNAIVLAGGGLKGFGLLGALQCMVDNKLFNENVKYYSGTSIGSVICYFLAIGYTPIEMTVYTITNKVFDTYDMKSIDSVLKGEGLYDFAIFSKHLEKMSFDKIGYLPTLLQLYENTGKILYTCTYNITQRKKQYISYKNFPDMLCIDAVRLSCSLPFIFNDCNYNDECFVDGGFVDNCPFSVITEYDDAIPIILNLQQKDSEDYYQKIIDKFYTIIMIPINELLALQIEKTKNRYKVLQLSLAPKVFEFNISHSDKLELFSIGYNTCKINLTI